MTETKRMPSEAEISSGYEQFVRGYFVCALWSSMDWSTESGGEPLDASYTPDDFDSAALVQAREECMTFLVENYDDLQEFCDKYKPKSGFTPWECAGHDFWLTRNRHGAGYWDRGLEGTGDRLTKAAHAVGEESVYVGADEKLHFE